MATFDEILRSLAGDVTPEGPFSPIGAKPTSGPSVTAPITPATTVASTRAEKFGARLARGIKSPFLKFLPGLGLLTETAQDGDTVPNAIRTGIGIGAFANPAIGGPLAVGTLAGEGIASGLDLAFQPGKSDILTPEFSKVVEAAGGPAAFIKGLGAKGASANPVPVDNTLRTVPNAGQEHGVGPLIPNMVSNPIRGIGANNQPFQPVTRTVNPDGTVTITGSGSAPFNDSSFSRFGALPGATFRPGRLPDQGGPVGNIAGNFAGALIGLKQLSGDNAIRAAQTKAQLEGLKAGSKIGLESSQGAKVGAETQNLNVRLALARVSLERDPSGLEAATILSGRPGPAPRFEAAGLGARPTDPFPVINQRTGEVTLTAPKQPITIEQAVASAKKNKTFKSEEQVRADIAKLPGFRLTN